MKIMVFNRYSTNHKKTKPLTINELKKHRYFSLFPTTSKIFLKNVWNLIQNSEIS